MSANARSAAASSIEINDEAPCRASAHPIGGAGDGQGRSPARSPGPGRGSPEALGGESSNRYAEARANSGDLGIPTWSEGEVKRSNRSWSAQRSSALRRRSYLMKLDEGSVK